MFCPQAKPLSHIALLCGWFLVNGKTKESIRIIFVKDMVKENRSTLKHRPIIELLQFNNLPADSAQVNICTNLKTPYQRSLKDENISPGVPTLGLQ